MKSIAHWTPVMFCVVISVVPLLVMSSDAWKPVFFCALPMCFFILGSTTFQMHKEIHSLRSQLAALQQTSTD